MPEVYADLDILILTSINEGTPVSIIEAMASSVPVISTDAGGVRDLIGPPRPKYDLDGFEACQRGLICRKGDANGLAKGIKFLLMNSGFREETSNVAREFVRRDYSAHRLLTEIESIYLNLIKGQSCDQVVPEEDCSYSTGGKTSP